MIIKQGKSNTVHSAEGLRTTASKVWKLLTRDQHRDLIVLLGLSLIGMLLEMAGVGLIIPALGMMTQADFAERYPALAPVLRTLGNPNQEQLVVGGMLTLVAVYLIKAVFLAFVAWRQMCFVNRVQSELSQKLFTGYLRQPYVFHLQRNSAQLIRNAVPETDLFSGTVLVAGLSLTTEVLVLSGVSALLLFIEPVGTFSVIVVFGLISWAFARITRRNITRWGVLRQEHEGARLQHLQQGLGGAKDVKLLGREDEFLSEFGKHNHGRARVVARQGTLNQLPRLWLELIAVAALAGLVFVMVYRSKPMESLLPIVGLFAVGAFRLLPSINRLMGSLQNLRYGLPAVSALYQDSQLLNFDAKPAPRSALHFTDALALDNVSFRYPTGHADVLRRISISVPCGSTFGFIGSTGSGKSTLVDVMLGLLQPTGGSVRVDGVDIQSNLRGWQDNLGYVPQSIFLTDDTVRRNVAFGLPNERIDDDAVWESLRAAQLDDFVRELPGGLETLVGERGTRLSGGQRQRIGIARALYHNPAVLVLDEATSSLDLNTEHEIMETIRALHNQKTIVIVAHRLSTVEHCDRLFRVERGEIVAEGAPAAMLARMAGQ